MDPSSRILTCASSTNIARRFVAALLSDAQLQQSDCIPWTICNKYYSADVHFLLTDLPIDTAQFIEEVPAILFVWVDGQPWRDDVLKLSQLIQHHGLDPQVCIAARLNSDQPSSDPNTDEDEDVETDDYLSTLSFEFVKQDSSSRDEIPGLPRVIDALSTIMWPNMQPGTKKTSINLLQKDPTLEEEDDGAGFPTPTSTSRDKMQKQVQELIQWLETEESSTSTSTRDPWKITPSSSSSSTGPGAGPEFTASPTQANDENAAESGFEDDFSDFVSVTAPPDDGSFSFSSFSSSFPSSSFPESGSSPFDSQIYKSLGSVSDLGQMSVVDPQEDYQRDDTKDEDDMPTEAEIRETSAQIFGWPPPSFSPAPSPTDPFPQPPLAPSSNPQSDPPNNAKLPPAPSQLLNESKHDPEGDELDDEEKEEDPDSDDLESANFDFSNVMSTLEGLKAQIAEMDDEGEKRKMAARVALGLVYGAGFDRGQI